MAGSDQEALQKGFKGLGENIDKLYARPLQKSTPALAPARPPPPLKEKYDECVQLHKMAYLCMAKCNDNSTASSETVNACMRRCEQPLQEVNQVVQQEVGGIQNRFQRCAMDCADEAKDTIPAGAKEGDASVEKAMAHNVKCTGVCVKKHLALLPAIEARIKSAAELAASQATS